ncbi:MAG: hypothetical protein KF819_26660 [Labilithrix sp.]|nr:hypothetical protein [Labilithrix sp.]
MIGAEAVVTPVAPAASAPIARANDRPPFEVGDRFVGYYYCAQGRTDLTLEITALDGDAIVADFAFDFPGGAGRPPAAGRFVTRGRFDRAKRSLEMQQEIWIDQPPGYVMVDLVGTLSPSGAYRGSVVGPDCSSFSLQAPPSRPPPK